MIKYLQIEDGIYKGMVIFADKTEHSIDVTREQAVEFMLEHHKPRKVYDKDGKTLLSDKQLAHNYCTLLEQLERKRKPTPKGGKREGAGRKPKDVVPTQFVGVKIRRDYVAIISHVSENLSDFIQKAVKEKLRREGWV